MLLSSEKKTESQSVAEWAWHHSTRFLDKCSESSAIVIGDVKRAPADVARGSNSGRLVDKMKDESLLPYFDPQL